jgi:hypothetical protein
MTYLEIPGGHHCFHLISSPRSWYTVISAGQWLTYHFDNPAAVEASQAKRLEVHEIVEWGWTV